MFSVIAMVTTKNVQKTHTMEVKPFQEKKNQLYENKGSKRNRTKKSKRDTENT